MPGASASENGKSIIMLRNIKDRGGEARGGTAGGWRDDMMADYGRMVEAMLSGLVRRLRTGNVSPVRPVLMHGRGEGPLGWAGLAGMTEHV